MSCCDHEPSLGCSSCIDHARRGPAHLASVARLFGHAHAHADPAGLAGPVDDFVYEAQAQLGSWIQQKAAEAADAGYEQFKARLNQDMGGLVEQAIASGKPRFQAELYSVFDDANTQARLGATSEQVSTAIRDKLIPLVGVAAIASAALSATLTYIVLRD